MMIPDGFGFGNRVATPAQGGQVGSTDGGLARAVGGLGATISGAAVDVMRTERSAADLAERERRAEEKTAAREALRAKTIVTLNGAKDKLADLHDDVAAKVLTGQEPKDKAPETFRTLSAKALEGVGADLPEGSREIVMAELTGHAARLENGVRKAVTKRDRQDVTAGIDQTLEYLQRQYRTDPAKATAQAMQTVDELGPHSELTPVQLAEKKQKWKERTQFTAGYEAVSGARDSRAGLVAAEKVISSLPDIDPQARATLGDRAAAYGLRLDQKADQEAQRREREAERHLKAAEVSFGKFQGLADKGTVLDPDYIDEVLTATTGTPYQAEIRALAQQARETGGLAAQPIAAQQRALDALNTDIAQNGRNPQRDRRKEQVEKVLRGSTADFEADGLRAGVERGIIDKVRPLDMSQGLPGIVGALAERVRSAEVVSTWAGRPAPPLLAEEAEKLKPMLDALPVKERSAAVATLAQALGPQASQGMAAQVDKKDKALSLAFAYAGTQTSMGRYTSELVLRGQQAKADGTSTKNEKQPELKVAEWSAQIATALEGAFPAQPLTDRAREAALLIAHGLSSEAGGQLRKRDLATAVNLAVGGSVVEHNGRNLALPAGVDADMLAKRLGAVTADELAPQAAGGAVTAGGRSMPLAEFVKALPGQPLMYAGPGRYAVIVGGRPVLGAGGRPVIVGVK